MTIPIQCHACSARYQLDRSDAGGQVECACGQLLTVPEFEPPISNSIRFQCPRCSGSYQVETDLAGEQVECECGQQLLVPTPDSLMEPSAREPNEPSDDFVRTAGHAPASSAEGPEGAPRPPEDHEEPDSVESSSAFETNESTRSAAARKKKRASRLSAEATEHTSEQPPAADPPKNRKGDAPSTTPTVLIVSLSIIGLGIVLAGVYSATSDSAPEVTPEPVVARHEAEQPQPAVEAVDDSHEKEPLPERRSLADRIRASQSPEPASAETSSDDGDEAAETGDQMVAANDDPVGVANPYQRTNANEFIALAPSKSGAGRNNPEAAKTGPAAKPVTKNSASTESEVEAAATKEKQDTARQTPATKRILFVRPERTWRGFDRTASEALRQFAELRALEKKAKGGAAADVEAWQTQLAATGGLLRIAQQQINSASDSEMAIRIQLILAWCYMESHQFYEAAVLTSHLAMNTPAEMVIRPERPKRDAGKEDQRPVPRNGGDSVGARLINAEIRTKKNLPGGDNKPAQDIYPKKEAATLALKALVTIYNQAPTDDRDVEYRQIVRIADLIHEVWPDYEQADGIRLFVAQLHSEYSAQREAALWYQRVSSDSPDHARAQLAAGQIVYSLYLNAKNSEQSDDPSTDAEDGTGDADEDVAEDGTLHLRERAQALLKKGIQLASDSGDLRENLFLAKLTLARMSLNEREFDAAIQHLTSEPDSLLAAVTEETDTARPATGIRSAAFSRVVLETAAKAHLGNDSVDEAILVLQQIEAVDDSLNHGLVAVYLDCCRKLSQRFQSSVDEEAEVRLDVLTDAVVLLQKLIDRKTELSSASLLSAATIATELADSVKIAEDAALVYAAAADFYQALLGVVGDENKPALRYRMAVAMRPAGRYEEAFAIFEEFLQSKPNVFDAQFEAARTLQAWGTAKQDTTRLALAMNGAPELPHVWGWRKMASTLQKLMDKQDAKPDHRLRFLDARNAVAECRIQIAACTEDISARNKELQIAATEIKMLATHMKSLAPADLTDLDATYQRILQELGQPKDSLVDEQP